MNGPEAYIGGAAGAERKETSRGVWSSRARTWPARWRERERERGREEGTDPTGTRRKVIRSGPVLVKAAAHSLHREGERARAWVYGTVECGSVAWPLEKFGEFLANFLLV